MFLILCGKSASGKDTIAKRLCRRGFEPLISYTTRPMREGERDFVDYVFLTKKDFEQRIAEDRFIEYRSYETLVDGKKDIWYYGTPKRDKDDLLTAEKDFVIVLDLEGAEKFMNYYGRQNCLCCFIGADKQTRTERAMKRGSFNKTEWERRLESDDLDFREDKLLELTDIAVLNGPFNSISQAVSKIIDAVECRFYDNKED